MRRSVLLALLAIAGCMGDALPEWGWTGEARAQGVVVGHRLDGEVVFARRLDGSIAEIFRTEVTGSGPEYLVVTGPTAGVDQCKVVVLSESGEAVAEYRPSGITPWPAGEGGGKPLYERVCPYPGRVFPFQRASRRFLAVTAIGNFSPSSFAILEWVSDRFVERFVFWNYGHIHQVIVGARHLVLLGVTSAFPGVEKDFSPAVAIFALDRIIGEGSGPVRGQSPTEGSGGDVPGAAYLWYMRISDDRGWLFQFEFWSPRIDGDYLVAPTASGLEYVIHLRSGRVTLRPGGIYPREYDLRPDRDELPELDTHLADLRAEMIVWHGR